MVEPALAHLRGANVVAILTRAPSSGGKSRLFAALGERFDAGLVEALLLDTVDGVRRSNAQAVLFVTPTAGVDEVSALAPDVPVVPQAEGSIGDRMREAMSRLFESGASSVAVVGSDLPTLDPAAVNAAFRTIADDPGRLVLGPTLDGGYYLVAAARVPAVFSDIAWGTREVIAQTMRAASAAGWPVHLVPALEDVDTPEGLERAVRAGAPRTGAWYRGHTGRQ